MAPQKAPPVTQVIAKTFLKNSDRPEALIQVAYEVLADDTTNTGPSGGAGTDFNYKGGVTDDHGNRINDANGNQVAFKFPDYAWGFKSGKKVVTALQGRLEVVFTLVIQTIYGPKAKADGPSAYGRGTTSADIASGETSLGFHESCHREDFLEFLKNNALPTYRGKVDITPEEFLAANRKFTREFADYFKRMRKFSDDRTDEVGYTRSEYKKKVPRK